MRLPSRRVVVASLVAVLGAGTYLVTHNGAAAAAGESLFVTAPGPGGGPHVRLFRTTGAQETSTSFYAYDPGFHGGVEVAMGDLNGDGQDEIITAAGPGGGPHVRVWTLGGAPIDKWSFMAYDPAFTGGVHLGVADVDGNGDMEIITGAGAGGGPHVRVWDIVSDHPVVKSERMAYDTGFHGGVFVAGAYTNADSDNESIVTAAGPGGGPHVKVWSPDLATTTNQFMAYNAPYNGGVSVTAFDEDGDNVDEIFTGALGGRGHIRSFDVNTAAPGDVSFPAFDDRVATGVQVAFLDDINGPLIVAPYGAGLGPCSVDNTPPNCANRGDYIRGYDVDGTFTLQALPYGTGWNGGVRVAAGFGIVPVNPPPTTTTSTSTTTTSTSTTSTSTTTTSTTVPETTTTTAAP
ncbi:MAG TPA: VCBS repeat-containing protein [Acidimicrobiales bacterium]|nr:VCBS repeat-containing protein [Acidimicrobiales bacterium]